MRRLPILFVVVAAVLAVHPGRAAGPSPLAGAAVRTFSIVVPDSDRFGAAWADVLGTTMPKVLEYPGLVFPSGYDAAAYPRIANFRMANVAVSMHQPAGGRSYWTDLLEAHGPALYRMNFQVPDLPATVSGLEQLDGRLVAATREGAGMNVNLWPQFGFAVELGARPAVAQPAPPPAPAAPVLAGFAANPVSKISFVVADIWTAVRPYAEIFGADVPAVKDRAATFPDGARVRRLTLRTALIDLPGDIDLELIEPAPGDNPWRAYQRHHGSRALFAVGVRVTNMAADVAHLIAKGGVLRAGGPSDSFALVDLTDRLGVQFELHTAAVR